MPKLSEKLNVLQQLPLILGLVLLWMMLWGEFSLMSLFGGIFVAFLIVIVFYLPSVQLSGRVNLWYLLVFLANFLFDVLRASFEVALTALNFWSQPKNAVVKIQLCTRDDFIITLVAESLSLVPGTLVVDVDRNHGRIYLHALNVKNSAGVEKVRRDSLRVERLIILAVGSKSDLAKLRKEQAKARAKKTTAKAAAKTSKRTSKVETAAATAKLTAKANSSDSKAAAKVGAKKITKGQEADK